MFKIRKRSRLGKKKLNTDRDDHVRLEVRNFDGGDFDQVMNVVISRSDMLWSGVSH